MSLGTTALHCSLFINDSWVIRYKYMYMYTVYVGFTDHLIQDRVDCILKDFQNCNFVIIYLDKLRKKKVF